MKPIVVTLALILFATPPLVAADPPKPFTGKVVRVINGDTISVLLDREEIRASLTHIDCPESKQAFSAKAKQALSE